jgi:EAL domain-containing protein (putative c-di-GMP-specific phosphodiesterase class I)
LLNVLRLPLVAEGRTIRATASIGVALADGAAETADDLLREADAAMYAAKAAGRAQAEFFDPRLHVDITRRMELVKELEGALQRGEFRLLYQPIARLTTGYIVGYEALLRWDHPRRGLLKPADFLEEAKMAGTIGPIGRFVIAEAIREIAELRKRRSDLRVHVNLSADQILEPDLDTFIDGAVRAGNIPARALVLEILEASIIESASASHRMLERLKRLGIALFVDDFGIGYSSLRDLRDLPVAGIKLDASFVSGLVGETSGQPIVRMLVELCSSLGLALVAEGVETPQQREALVRMGCLNGQGNLLGPPEPVPAEAVLANW